MKFFSAVLFSTLFMLSCELSAGKEVALMKKAIPVWAKGREKEMNLNMGFHGTFTANDNDTYNFRITASTLYRVFLNGEFLGYGPARAAHGYFRVDEYQLKNLKEGANHLAIEVAGYNSNSYYTIDQPSFLQAELESNNQIILSTGNNSEFKAFQIKERLQKTERYSFQRPFTEYYRMQPGFNNWKTGEITEPLALVAFPPGKLISRVVQLPDYKISRPCMISLQGTIQYIKPRRYYRDRSLNDISDELKGFKADELEVTPSQWIQEIVNKTEDKSSIKFDRQSLDFKKDEFITLEFPANISGFLGGGIHCETPSKVIFYFDEILTNGDVNTKKRMADVNNQVVYEFEPGDYKFETFEAYTFKYLKFIVLEGECSLDNIYMREYAYPANPKATFSCSNDKLNKIYDAAWNTYRQNAVDIFMDCPSRERAGWLCDSYFMAITEKDFTGRSDVAYNFYENYALPDSFAFLPEGMIPMCYPADHYNGNFIPNWAMWFIIQIDDYARRGGDKVLIERLKPRITNLLNYFAKLENEDQLLEKLEAWVFVEWSQANSFTQDVNYPSNMLYAAALESAASLYNNKEWKTKAEKIRQTILKQSFNGQFFIDNARRRDGKLTITENKSEVCQYYAFFCNVATPESHPELWKKLTTEFGPDRDDKITYPDVFRANAFIGNYLRVDLLSRYGLEEQLLQEIQDFFYHMAETTGTLWENMGTNASCNHGFASYLAHILYRDVLGVREIDFVNKKITIRFTGLDLKECSGSIPIADDAISLAWERNSNEIIYSLSVPNGFDVKIENKSNLKLRSRK